MAMRFIFTSATDAAPFCTASAGLVVWPEPLN